MLLDTRRLHRYMSGPEWSAAQWIAAEDVLAGAEQDLADALYGAVIEPFEHTETVPLDRDGAVATSWPVFALISVDGQTATDDTNAPGYRVVRHRLRSIDPTPGVAGSLLDFLPGRGLTGHPDVPVDPWVGRVAVHYMAGWGPEPALVAAILEKASIRMGNRHSDSMVITGVSAQNVPAPPPRHWTADELATLARYRNLGWGNR